MADFTDGFWNMYVAGFVVFGLLLCAVLLVFNMTARQSGEPKVQGHVWDETLKEYNNPLPSWWLFLFWGTIIFAVVYLVVYPGFGNRLSDGKVDKGLRSEYAADVKATESLFSRYANSDLNSLASDSKLMETTGRRLFLTYCSQCHASTGKGAGKGFPNLTDGDWLYGGDLAAIKTSIEEGRAGMMTPLGAVLNEEERRQVANYVRQLAGESADAALAAKGKEIFLGKGTCTTCHGQNGTGMKETGWPGAPNLTDNVWLYGSDEKTIMEGIEKGRNAGEGSLTNNMQPWKGFLSEGKINLLTAYVYSLSQKK